MSEQLADKQHNPTPGLATLYQRWAQGGIGLSITGNVMVEISALGKPNNMVLDEQSDIALFSWWANVGKQNGSQIWVELNHPGKQILQFLYYKPVAPSAIFLGRGLKRASIPHAL